MLSSHLWFVIEGFRCIIFDLLFNLFSSVYCFMLISMTRIVDEDNSDFADAYPSFYLHFHGLSHTMAVLIGMSAITVIFNLDHFSMPFVNFVGGWWILSYVDWELWNNTMGSRSLSWRNSLLNIVSLWFCLIYLCSGIICKDADVFLADFSSHFLFSKTVDFLRI